jgi:hypothetical protein
MRVTALVTFPIEFSGTLLRKSRPHILPAQSLEEMEVAVVGRLGEMFLAESIEKYYCVYTTLYTLSIHIHIYCYLSYPSYPSL